MKSKGRDESVKGSIVITVRCDGSGIQAHISRDLKKCDKGVEFAQALEYIFNHDPLFMQDIVTDYYVMAKPDKGYTEH